MAAPLQAQTVRGVVLDDTDGRPLSGVLLTLSDNRARALSRRSTRTDSLGRFMLHAGERGQYFVRATRIGYAPLTSERIVLEGGEVATTHFRLGLLAQKLGTVTVNGNVRLNGWELLSTLGYELRRANGRGKFLDSADLKRYGGAPVSETLVGHGVGVNYLGPDAAPKQLSGRQAIAARMALNSDSLVMVNGLTPDRRIRTCTPEVWIDGFIASHQSRLLGLGADMIHGVEVYGHNQLPPASIGGELGMLQMAKKSERMAGHPVRVWDDPECGVIVIWTKANAAQAAKPPRK